MARLIGMEGGHRRGHGRHIGQRPTEVIERIVANEGDEEAYIELRAGSAARVWRSASILGIRIPSRKCGYSPMKVNNGTLEEAALGCGRGLQRTPEIKKKTVGEWRIQNIRRRRAAV